MPRDCTGIQKRKRRNSRPHRGGSLAVANPVRHRSACTPQAKSTRRHASRDISRCVSIERPGADCALRTGSSITISFARTAHSIMTHQPNKSYRHSRKNRTAGRNDVNWPITRCETRSIRSFHTGRQGTSRRLFPIRPEHSIGPRNTPANSTIHRSRHGANHVRTYSTNAALWSEALLRLYP